MGCYRILGLAKGQQGERKILADLTRMLTFDDSESVMNAAGTMGTLVSDLIKENQQENRKRLSLFKWLKIIEIFLYKVITSEFTCILIIFITTPSFDHNTCICIDKFELIAKIRWILFLLTLGWEFWWSWVDACWSLFRCNPESHYSTSTSGEYVDCQQCSFSSCQVTLGAQHCHVDILEFLENGIICVYFTCNSTPTSVGSI